ncbi:hypothetical protein MRB53_032440 [Persea americana]|uniref:Uncharacterized protein n=1 Tax=Persea americana TaxID=3435 RepID=A0ACC2KRV7_PERAE|nr:hypothetical protein MRB53_032440 [Persea americana]
MARNKGKTNASTPGSGHQNFGTLREEKSGKKHTQVATKKSYSSMLRMQHLQNLATWASGTALIPPLGALFGHRLAASAESLGTPLDPSLFPCQRCETILQPGYNCTIRIEKNRAKRRRSKKLSVPSQNNVVYTCHFCSHRNLKRGTPKGHMKEISSSNPKLTSASKPGSMDQKSAGIDKGGDTKEEIISLKSNPISESNSDNPKKGQAIREIAIESSPVTPFTKVGNGLPENRKNSGLGSNKISRADKSSSTAETGKATSGSSKRKRKGWSSLKEIAENMERQNTSSIGNLTVPFFL